MSFADDVRATFRSGDTAEVMRMVEAEVRRARRAGEPAGEVEAVYAMSRVALRAGEFTLNTTTWRSRSCG